MTAKTTTPVRYALTLLAGAGTLAALAACSSTATAGTDSADETTAPSSAASEPATTSTDAAAGDTAAGDSAYADGTYDAEGAYTSPGGNETVGVELTLEGGVVTAVTVTPQSENPTGEQYQERFASGISGEVVGVPLDELDVSVVSGSSLTSGGFNDAVETIKADAAA